MVDLDARYKTLETAHRRALFGAVSKEGIPYRGAVRSSERPQLAVVCVSDSCDWRRWAVLVLYPPVGALEPASTSFELEKDVKKLFES